MNINKISNKKLISCLKSCALLDIDLCEEEHLRCYRYYPNWKPNVQLATYDNGSGDNLFIIFVNEAALIKGFDHESEVSPYAGALDVWPGMYDGTPTELLQQLEDEALEKEDVTFCLWRDENNGEWQRGSVVFNNNEDDGSSWLLSAIKTTPEEYIEWGKEYYEEDFNKIPLQRVYDIFKECE